MLKISKVIRIILKIGKVLRDGLFFFEKKMDKLDWHVAKKINCINMQYCAYVTYNVTAMISGTCSTILLHQCFLSCMYVFSRRCVELLLICMFTVHICFVFHDLSPNEN